MCHLISVLSCEGDQVGVRRITFMSDMRRKDPGTGSQHAFQAHSRYVLDYLADAEMVSARLFRTIRVIQDYSINLIL